jgi:hypothetical protein
VVALDAAMSVIFTGTPAFFNVHCVFSLTITRDDGDHARVVTGGDRLLVGMQNSRYSLKGTAGSWFKIDAFRLRRFVFVHGFRARRTQARLLSQAGAFPNQNAFRLGLFLFLPTWVITLNLW